MARAATRNRTHTICNLGGVESLTHSDAAATFAPDRLAADAHMQLREEYEQLYGEYVVLRQQAQRLGELMCEIGHALRHQPESIVVKPSPREPVVASAIVLTKHPPTLLAIERLATDIRTVMGRLVDLQSRRPADHQPT